MKIIEQSWEFLNKPDAEQALRLIEAAGRVCYKTEGKMGPGTAPDFIRKRIATGHHSVIEHVSITVRIITDRGVTHEIVRHRLASYSQESTRYCNYGEHKMGIKFILPVDFELDDEDLAMLRMIENHYNRCLEKGRTPQQARYFLPNGLKTEIIMTCNVREWRHFFTLRPAPAAHAQMRALASSMLAGFKEAIPVLFEDL